VLTAIAQTAFTAGLLSASRIPSSIGINLGFFGLLGAAVGATRRASLGLRVGPVIVGTLVAAMWPAVSWILTHDLAAADAFISVGTIFGTMIAIVGTLVFLARRGLIVNTPVRSALTLALVLLLSVSALISVPTGVWKGRMGVAALVALFLILLWPARRAS